MQPDFSHLYRAIDVRPESSLAAFRQAFRRHVASRHPDRADGNASVDDDAPSLAEINALYEMAMRFHRRHGRLPGAAAAAATPTSADEAAPEPRTDPRPNGQRTVFDTDGRDRTIAESASGSTRRWIPWLVVAALLVVAIGVWQAPSHSRRAVATTAVADASAPDDAPPTRLALGMRAETVRAIQGEPLRMRGGEWDYGPSWLRFERGRLADWYSSPLNRLKTETASPRDIAPVDADAAMPAETGRPL